MSRKIGLLVALAVMATMAFGASAAQAADKATCQFSGIAGIADPGVQAVENDAADQGGLGDTDSGSYEFGTQSTNEATCVRIESDVDDPPTNSGVYTVDIDSAGTYVNTVCGTGTADDTAPSSTSFAGTAKLAPPGDASGLEGPVSPTYHIQFVGGQGALSVTGGTWDGGSLSGGGYVAIVPTENDGDPDTHACVDEDVTKFTVAGAFAAVAP